MAGQLTPVFRRLLTQQGRLTSAAEFCVEAVPCRCPAYLGCSRSGRPAVFVDLGGAGGAHTGTRILNLEVQHAIRSDLRLAGGQGVCGTYSIVICHASDPALQEVFLDAVENVLARVDAAGGPDALDRELEYLVDLFRTLAMPGTRTWLGIWGELFVIHSARDRSALLQAWHVDPANLHDFAAGVTRLEVKASTLTKRVHEFGLEQLVTPDPVLEVYVASVLTNETIAGVSVEDLHRELRARFTRSPRLVRHLDLQVASVLGSAYGQPGPRYDYDHALASLRVYRAHEVPQVVNASCQVDGVRFRSDLSCSAVLSPEEVAGLPLVGALRTQIASS